MSSPPRIRDGAAVTAWGNALLAGRVSPDAMADALAPARHHVDGARRGSLPYVLLELRAAGARQLRLVLPVPGDVSALPGPVEFTRAALEARMAVVVPQARLGLLPAPADGPADLQALLDGLVVWTAHEVSGPALEPAVLGAAPTVRAAERDLVAAMTQAADVLVTLDVGHATDEQVAGLARVRRPALPSLPPGHPAQAVRLAHRAFGLLEMTTVAALDEGAAHSATAITKRQETISALQHAARTAIVAAVSLIPTDQA